VRAALDCLLSPSGALELCAPHRGGSTQRSPGPVSENVGVPSELRVIQEQSGQSTCTTWRLQVQLD
jgi:hypothetical protein